MVALLWSGRLATGARAWARTTLVLDPGIDLAKTPAESVEVLRRLAELERLGRPLLLAISRKDFVGAITGRAPGRARRRHAGRDGAARSTGRRSHPARARRGRGVSDFLSVRAALREPGRSRCRARAARGPKELRTQAECSMRSSVHDRPDLRPSLRPPALHPQPARPRDRGDERARARRGDRVRRPDRTTASGASTSWPRVPRPAGVRADDGDPGQPRLAQRGLRALRGAVRRAPPRAARRAGCRSWPWTPPSRTSTTA